MELRKARRHRHHHRSLPATGPLMLACQQESKEDVRNILERQPGVGTQRDPTGKNALHYCAENKNVDCASRILSSHPPLLNAPDDEGYTPLHLAVISGNKAMVKYLLTKGADASAVDSEKHSCVHWATVSGDCDVIDLLISSGANPSTPDIHGAYPVHYAAQMCGPNSEMGNDVRMGLAVLRKLLSKRVNVACVDRDGRPPLLWAASGGSSDAILALVKAGADVNATDREGLTALHCAASRGHVDCLETLLSLCGAEVDKVDEGGCTALFYAAALGNADCTNMLLSFGSHSNRQDNRGRTPAHCGAAKGQMETLKILAQHKANLWLRNAKGDMPLHEAVQSGRKDLVEWFLRKNRESVNVSNANGRTPLHIAAITNNVDMCKVLMDYGAFVNPIMRNSKGQHLTPMDAALHRGNRSCAKYLSLHGALPASKLVEKREYNRFTETQFSETLEMSPNTKHRIFRDSSAQTEGHSRDVNTQAQVDLRTVAAATTDLEPVQSPGRIKTSCSEAKIRCPAKDGTGKPIIAKVYVHTKKPKFKRLARKPTAYRRDYQAEKLLSRQQQRLIGNIQSTENGASNTAVDSISPPQTDRSNDFLSRKASHPVLLEDTYRKTITSDAAQQTSEELRESDSMKQIPEEAMMADATRQISEEMVMPATTQQISKEQHKESPSPVRENHSHTCECYETHETSANNCNCTCHESRGSSQLLPVEKRRRSSLITAYETENQSPMSSIRSLESTIKDSGFSDDLERGVHHALSSDEDNDISDSENSRVKRKRRHIARYIVSSGAAETFRLDEEEEDDERKVTIKPRSSSLPHLKKQDEKFETCPRLLNRPTITKEVQRSLKKYQMERRLFYELQELKRKQITTLPNEEREVVIKMVKRFRNYVLGPTMDDFQGPNTFMAFEKYLYGQLRKLSMGGKIPKPKASTKDRVYATPMPTKNSREGRLLCTCETQCHHRLQKSGSDLGLNRTDNSEIPLLPDITQNNRSREKPSRTLANRSKSWNRLEDSTRKNSTLVEKLSNMNIYNSLPSLSNPFPRRVPAALLAAISEKLGTDVHPDDTVVVEMSSDSINSKMRHAFTVQELQEVVSRYEEQSGRKVKPIPLETVIDPDDDGPITFEIRHGKEKNVFRLPAGKLKDNKKWQVTFTIGKWQKDTSSIYAK